MTVTEEISLQSQLASLPPYQRRILSHVRLCASEDHVWKASREKKKLTIATDGGLKNIRGTFGWTLSTAKNIPCTKVRHRSTVHATLPTLLVARLRVSLRHYSYSHYWQDSGVLGSNANSDGCVTANPLSQMCRNTHQAHGLAGSAVECWFSITNLQLASGTRDVGSTKADQRPSINKNSAQ
jgi:hypothetical protein